MGFGVWGLGFGVWGLGFRVWGLGFGVYRVQVLRFRAYTDSKGFCGLQRMRTYWVPEEDLRTTTPCCAVFSCPTGKRIRKPYASRRVEGPSALPKTFEPKPAGQSLRD